MDWLHIAYLAGMALFFFIVVDVLNVDFRNSDGRSNFTFEFILLAGLCWPVVLVIAIFSLLIRRAYNYGSN